jgi:hypothetical protein
MKNIYLVTLLIIGLAVFTSCNRETSHQEEKEVEINIAQLPQLVQNNIRLAYTGCKMIEADQITHTGGNITYDVELTHNGKTIEVMYDANGTFLGEENEDGEEDEKDDDKESEKED